jgi:GNAT superfamily N-acetyltransferase
MATTAAAFSIVEVGEGDDMAEIAGLFRQYRDVLLGLDVPIDLFQGFGDEIDHLPGKYGRSCGGALWVARDAASGNPLGCIAIKLLDAAVGLSEVKRLYVVPAARGRGVAKVLCLTAVEAARALGYRRLVLDTLHRLRGAAELYGKLGFSACAPYTHNPMPDVVFMHLLLTATDRTEGEGGAVTHSPSTT